MSETNKNFTPEQIREFEDKYNIGVNNHEAMVELFMQLDERISIVSRENVVWTYDLDKRIFAIEEQIEKRQAILWPDVK